MNFRDAVEAASAESPKRLVLEMTELSYMASAGLRVLIFAKQKMGSDVDIYVIGVQEAVNETITMTGFNYSVIMLDEYDADEIENDLNDADSFRTDEVSAERRGSCCVFRLLSMTT